MKYLNMAFNIHNFLINFLFVTLRRRSLLEKSELYLVRHKVRRQCSVHINLPKLQALFSDLSTSKNQYGRKIISSRWVNSKKNKFLDKKYLRLFFVYSNVKKVKLKSDTFEFFIFYSWCHWSIYSVICVKLCSWVRGWNGEIIAVWNKHVINQFGIYWWSYGVSTQP